MLTVIPGFGVRVIGSMAAPFGHQFGGGQEYLGTTPSNGSKPVHLLFRLNLEDPAMPLRLHGVKWLPLFYAFQYDASPMAYQIISDSEIRILGVQRLRYEPNFPFQGYPEFFPKTFVNLIPIQYEEQRAVVLYHFLVNHLISKDALTQDDKAVIESIGTEFTKIGGPHQLLQPLRGRPCPNENCENHKLQFAMETIATVWNEPIKGVDLWRSGGESIEIVYQICPLCGTIYTLNQCT